MPRPRRQTLLTIGYEGLTVAQFVDRLQAEAVVQVIDVRELPLSRRRGFSKTPLANALQGAGIEYTHIRAAGNPYRHIARDDVTKCLRLYRKHLARSPEVVFEVLLAVGSKRSALMCMEAHADGCHRTPVADALVEAGNFRVKHL